MHVIMTVHNLNRLFPDLKRFLFCSGQLWNTIRKIALVSNFRTAPLAYLAHHLLG